MNNGEFFFSGEENKISEYKYFPAEIYRKDKEENYSGKEKANGGSEITTLQKRRVEKKANKDGSSKSVVDKIFSSIKSVATTATVAVAAAVVTTTLVINSPKVDLKNIDTGSDFVEYEMEISDLDENKDYSIVISTSNEEDIEIEVIENGVYKNKVEGLKPEWEYTLSLICLDTALGDVSHFEVKFQTLKYTEQQPEPPPEDEPDLPKEPDTYSGEYTLPATDDIVPSYQTMELSVPIIFDNVDGKYYYVITLCDGDGNELSRKTHNGTQNVILPLLDDTNIYSVGFELYGLDNTLIEQKSIGVLDYTPPSVDILDVTIASMNEIKIDFTVSSLREDTQLQFNLAYDGLMKETVKLTDNDISKGYLIVTMESGSLMTLDAVSYVKYNGSDSVRVVEYPRYEKEFENNFYAEALVGSSGMVTFYPSFIANGAEFIYVVNSNKPNEPYINYDLINPFSVECDGDGEITYTMYLSNENGDKLSNEVAITVDASLEIPKPEFNMIYRNPNEVAVTYNGDGTVNLYIKTDFESSDEEVYYQVRVGNKRYRSRERVIEITDLEDKSYGIEYDVCKDINGVQYSLFNYHPSGAVNEYSVESVCYVTYEDELSLNLEINTFNTSVDLSNIRIVSSSGEEITLKESDFTYDEENYLYKASLSLTKSFEYVTVYVEANANANGLEDIENYKGSINRPYEMTVYR